MDGKRVTSSLQHFVSDTVCCVFVALVLLASSCTGSDTEQVQPTAVPVVPSPVAPMPTPSSTPPPTPTPLVTINQLPDLDGALDVEPAPLGTFVVARREAGIKRAAAPGQVAPLEIPVYDEPFGPPRSLLDMNFIDGINLPVTLTNWDDPDGVLVMRVIAGGPDDDWLLVQAPVRPNDSYVWVRRGDFDFGYTSTRIEIDLANEGLLQVFEGDVAILRSAIVQGRESRETPTHVTYLESGVLGAGLSPAYGEMILSMASFSEQLGTFGGGRIPSNYLHGTNHPELMGQRVSSGEIRIPNEAIVELAELVSPGTPVLMYDSSGARSTREQILSRPLLPAATTRFLDGAAPGQSATDGVMFVLPKLWSRCAPSDSVEQHLVCRNNGEGTGPSPAYIIAGSETEHVFAVAKPDAGAVYLRPDEAMLDEPPTPRRMIPVFDAPGGPPKALVYSDEIDGLRLGYPLYAETVFNQPTVLSVVMMSRNKDWLLVRAPVRPHDTSVWVRGSDFELQSTSLRVEVDLGYEFVGKVGMLTVWDGDQTLMAARISSGRETRPTVPTSTYIDQIIEGGTLSRAYGPWLLSTPSYSERLGTFGGGGMPQQSIHGINAELSEYIGTPSSSGSIHVAHETILEMVEVGDLVGARVVLYDSRSPRTTEDVVRNKPLTMAETVPIELVNRDAPVGSFT